MPANRLDRGIQGFIGAISEISFNVLPALAYLLLAVVVMVQIKCELPSKYANLFAKGDCGGGSGWYIEAHAGRIPPQPLRRTP